MFLDHNMNIWHTMFAIIPMHPGSARSETTEVRETHRFDEASLTRHLVGHLSGFHGPLRVRQFEGGQSNPTYLLQAGSGDYVLRKKPLGTLLPTAHQIEREYRVMTALRDSGVPVPATLLMCDDLAVIGAAFFVMGCVEGRVFRHPHLLGVSPADRGAMYDDMAAVLARLHAVDIAGVGLGDYGRTGNYFARQIDRWGRQYRAAQTGDIPAMEHLMVWLPAHIPAGDESTIVHGDYRVENLIFHPSEPRIVAVVDWELSTLGHPLADLAYSCLTYHLSPDLLVRPVVDADRTGIPDEATYVASYGSRTGRTSIPDWHFYLAFAMFRLASILQGVYARGLRGNAASAEALQRGAAAHRIAERGWEMAQGASGLS